jgi:hypothetical protein
LCFSLPSVPFFTACLLCYHGSKREGKGREIKGEARMKGREIKGEARMKGREIGEEEWGREERTERVENRQTDQQNHPTNMALELSSFPLFLLSLVFEVQNHQNKSETK